MIILGLNAYHGDSSACIIIDGRLIAAAEEERFRRIKHWAGFPTEAIKYCLLAAGVSIEKIDHIAVNRNPGANIIRKSAFAFARHPSIGLIKDRLNNAAKIKDIKTILSRELGAGNKKIKAKVHFIEHHLAHLASAFFVSPFEDSAVISVDGFGDFVGAMWGVGQGNKIKVRDRIFFPHSLGLFYLAFTQYLGFSKYGDEYKVMGLSAFGKPDYFIFVAIFRKTKVLRESQVEKPQRMRKKYPIPYFYLISLSYTPHRSHKIAKAVYGNNCAIFKRRNEKCAGKMRQVMLYEMNFGFYFFISGPQFPA
jgi:predicted NodU family carbamoyl transferase